MLHKGEKFKPFTGNGANGAWCLHRSEKIGVKEKIKQRNKDTWTNSWFSFFILYLAGYTCLQWERPADAESQSKEGDWWWSQQTATGNDPTATQLLTNLNTVLTNCYRSNCYNY